MTRTALLIVLLLVCLAPAFAQPPVGYRDTPVIPGQKWRVHDIDRPRPPSVTPAAVVGQPPADAVVLFEGKDLLQWQHETKTGPIAATWKVIDGYIEEGRRDLVSKDKFGDCQIHLEWMEPPDVKGASQDRGNSGVLIMHRYEVQVLDSHTNVTYADGQAGAIYGQWPPLVNATRPAGQWQAYDIVFEAPKFVDGKLTKSAYMTVFLNGVLLHNRQEMVGPMAHRIVAPWVAHGAEEPLALQDHGNNVRFRNIWVRRLKGYDQQ